MNSKLTPLMRQYWDIKVAHKDKVLLFRMGDFFEIFHDDAVTAAPVLGIALTKRNQKSADETPMCGVPHHSIGTYINKLLKAGHKVAMCDQIEDPKLAKGLVKRAVTRILTPGMVFDPDQLDQLTPNYIAALDSESVAFADPSTGEAFYFEAEDEFERSRLLEVLRPSELLLAFDQESEREALAGLHLTMLGAASAKKSARDNLRDYIEGLEVNSKAPEIKFEKRGLATRLELTQNTIRHLELFENNRGQPQSSLFAVVNKTRTPGGSRLLRSWLAFPLAKAPEILERQGRVESWIQNPAGLKSVREGLQKIGDLERRTMRVANSASNARDMLSLCQALTGATEVETLKP
ncbi:MAG: DNA mismatch repair protein MutS, partial [Bdellovibrionia bacterium]